MSAGRFARLAAGLDRLTPLRERLVLTGGVAALLGLYLPVNHLTARREPLLDPATRIDDWVPFVPAWMGLYGLLYAYLLLPAVLPMERRSFRAVASAYAATTVLSLAAFVAVPVHKLDRPADLDTSGFWEWLLALTHWIDTPSNCLPSLHVSLSLLASLCAASAVPALGRVVVPLGLLIGVSTLFVEQHWWADVWTGWLLGGLAWAVLVRGRVQALGFDAPGVRGSLACLLAAQGLLALGAWGLFRSQLVQPERLPVLTARPAASVGQLPPELGAR